MPPVALALAFLAVMAGALACFVRAFLLRRGDRKAHVRWAVAGAAIDVLGTLAVIFTSRVLGWHVPPVFPRVATVHRAFAYVATTLLLVQAVSGARRWRGHGPLGVVFLAVYAATYGLAVWAYAPWW